MCTIIYYAKQLVLYFIFNFPRLHLKEPAIAPKNHHRSESIFKKTLRNIFQLKYLIFCFLAFKVYY